MNPGIKILQLLLGKLSQMQGTVKGHGEAGVNCCVKGVIHVELGMQLDDEGLGPWLSRRLF